MNTKPIALSAQEMREVASIKAIREMWGAETVKEMYDMLNTAVYAAKFDYVAGSPGYVGDLYILHGDALGEPVTLIRDHNVLRIL